MIFSYVMLDIRSISFQKYKNKIKFPVIWNSYPEPNELQVWKAFSHMQLAFSLSFVKLLWPFERIISYTHDQDHVHVHSHAILLHLEGSKYIHASIHPQIKLYVVPCLSLSKGMGYTKRNKRCIPKEGMPHAHKACQKKEKKCISKEGMPHASKAWQ